ncbi:MAG: ShlB/FhaC/HecB family hemolysin secretion/activation protein [Stellaceae bacterium]
MAVMLLCVAGFALPARGQAVTPSGAVQPGQTRPLPEARSPKFQFRIESTSPSPVPSAVERVVFTIRNIRVVGNTVFPASAFRPFIAPLVGKKVHLSDIIHVADEIEAKYRRAGYVLTRVYVPPQTVSNGVFGINVIEGYVAAVSVTGGTADIRARVERILAPVSESRPLKLKVIETALLRANELPGVGVSGLLRPSPTRRGASDLVVKVSAPRVTVLLSVDNRGAPLTDSWTGAASFAIRSPFGQGGVVLLSLASAPDPHVRYSIGGKYVYPVGDDGLMFSLSALDSHGQPAGSIPGANFVSNNHAYGARLTYPVIVSRAMTLSLDGGFTWQTARIDELAGTLGAHDEWRELDLALIFRQNGFLDGITDASLDVTQGLPVLGASAAGDPTTSRGLIPADPSFTKLSGVARRVQHLFGRFDLAATAVGQYGFDTLYLGEEIAFGGAQIGRGYDPAALTGDSGLGGDVELRYHLNTAGWRIDSPKVRIDHAELYGFYDAAKVWDHTGTIDQDFIASTGFGVRATVADKLQLGLEAAFPLVRVETSDFDKKAMRVLFDASIKF